MRIETRYDLLQLKSQKKSEADTQICHKMSWSEKLSEYIHIQNEKIPKHIVQNEFAIISSCVLYATLHLLILSVNCLISLLVGHILLFLGSDVIASMSCRTRVNRYIRPSNLPKSQPFCPNPIPNHSLKAFIQAQWLKSKTNPHRLQISQLSWYQSWLDKMVYPYSTGIFYWCFGAAPLQVIFLMNMQWNST